ncbi:MAG: hypothetical protein HY279_11245, partial [Nitrospinae bacterium]|nr:hypothetical protein [Nitrospinota bacterium]
MEGPGFVIGNIAKGNDLWDRQEEIKGIMKALEKSSILLKAPRRFGKTSIMYRIYEESSDFKTIFVDTEGMRDPQDFIAGLMTELLSDKSLSNIAKMGLKKIGSALTKVEEISLADFRLKIREGIGREWHEKGCELVSKIKDYTEKDILFILDELPLLVQNIMRQEGEKTSRDFLHWFRSIRQMPELSRVRWLVGGSIGIEHILAKIGVGVQVINDFQILRICPFSEIEGRKY